jgi:hypothetical protein
LVRCKSATIARKPARHRFLKTRASPEPRLTAHDRQAQRELSGPSAGAALTALKPEKLASVTKKSLLDSSHEAASKRAPTL